MSEFLIPRETVITAADTNEHRAFAEDTPCVFAMILQGSGTPVPVGFMATPTNDGSFTLPLLPDLGVKYNLKDLRYKAANAADSFRILYWDR